MDALNYNVFVHLYGREVSRRTIARLMDLKSRKCVELQF